MGKQLRQQRRGRGGSQYRSPSHRHVGDIRYPRLDASTGKIEDFIHAPGRNGPLAKIDFNGEKVLMIAAEGMMVGNNVSFGDNSADRTPGSVVSLSSVPEGSFVYNIEGQPGDGGKFVRTAGTSATVVSRGSKVVLLMPSGEFKSFDPRCRATVGVVAGGGLKEKPFAKSGNKYHAYRSKSKAYFKVKGIAMNAVDHPHGGGGHPHVGVPSTVSRNAAPGRKVGRLSPKRRRK
ncbi:50S ribosomal protein L2 [Candidatus Methanomassiliicoccus intestinalis]|uniref:50S ribosomal protein L2 n=1 Tax=Candidatus Methanomassiliicoccus intestinalis TaxID=1406512 RepID=UPI00064FF44B|nr:50S ribosomal protein L2 [Candidatus Methanomassiliicoccus intestinalis]